MKIGIHTFHDGKEPKDLENKIKKLKKQLKIAIEGLITIINDGDDYWDKEQADYYLNKIKELEDEK